MDESIQHDCGDHWTIWNIQSKILLIPRLHSKSFICLTFFTCFTSLLGETTSYNSISRVQNCRPYIHDLEFSEPKIDGQRF